MTHVAIMANVALMRSLVIVTFKTMRLLAIVAVVAIVLIIVIVKIFCVYYGLGDYIDPV